MEEDERLFLQSIRAGVLGFVPKEGSALDVVAAVRSLARGEAVCPPRLCKFLFDFVAAQVGRAAEQLRQGASWAYAPRAGVDSDDRARTDQQGNR